jgi:MFS family permease
MWVVIVVAFASLCTALMQSLVIPIQGEFAELLNTSASTASWVVTATLLGGAVAMPIAGRLADMIGKKPVLVGSALILVAGSLVCALSSSATLVIAGRVLQGFAMGFIPVAISLVRELSPAHMRNTAVAGVSATLGVGGALGLPLAAWIAQDYNWHILFWVAFGLAAVMTVAVAIVIPHIHDAHPATFDVVGAIGIAVGLVALLVGISKGSSWGWDSATTIGFIAGGLVVLLVWGWYELRHHDPLVDLRTSAQRPILMTNIAALLIGFGMMAMSIVIPQLLQLPVETGNGMGQSVLAAGLWMAPGGLMMMAFAPVSAKMLTRYGGRITLSVGAFVIAGGYLVAILLTNAPWELLVASLIICAGVGIGYAAMPTLILTNAPEEEAASSVGVNALMRSMGTTIAGAVMAAILTGSAIELGSSGVFLPTQSAFHLCFIIGAIAAAAGASVALLARPSSKRADAVEAADEELVAALS